MRFNPTCPHVGKWVQGSEVSSRIPNQTTRICMTLSAFWAEVMTIVRVTQPRFPCLGLQSNVRQESLRLQSKDRQKPYSSKFV